MEDEAIGGLTEYVVTRWYRAPEIMLACQEYTSAIDIWSVGCIFAELLARSPLFPGEDYIAQLRLICEKLGRPSDKDLDFVTSERAKRFMKSLPNKPPIAMQDLFPAHRHEKDALDLLKKMLEIHPLKRITIEKALEHPFLESLHNVDDEPVHDHMFSFEFEKEELSREKIQQLIWEELRDFHPELPPHFPSSTQRRKSKLGTSDEQSNAESKSNGNTELDDPTQGSDDCKATKRRSITPVNSEK